MPPGYQRSPRAHPPLRIEVSPYPVPQHGLWKGDILNLVPKSFQVNRLSRISVRFSHRVVSYTRLVMLKNANILEFISSLKIGAFLLADLQGLGQKREKERNRQNRNYHRYQCQRQPHLNVIGKIVCTRAKYHKICAVAHRCKEYGRAGHHNVN